MPRARSPHPVDAPPRLRSAITFGRPYVFETIDGWICSGVPAEIIDGWLSIEDENRAGERVFLNLSAIRSFREEPITDPRRQPMTLDETENEAEKQEGPVMSKPCAICGNDLGHDLFASVTGEKCCTICKVKFIGGPPTSNERISAARGRLGLADGEYLRQDNGSEAARILWHR